MTEKEVIERVLNLEFDEDGTISTLAVSIRGARELTERNIETGEKNPRINIDNLEKQIENKTFASNKLIGITAYLIIIDLIGNMFKAKGKSESNDRFKQALNQFTNLNNCEIESLKNLRNSVAHKFSLGNESEVFVLDYSENSAKILQKATEIYPSTVRNRIKEEKNMTTIYFHNVCNLVEDIYLKINKLNDSDNLEILNKYKNGLDVKIYDFNSMYFIK